MKRILTLAIMINAVYAFVGLGLTGGTNSISYSASESLLLIDDREVGSFSHNGFKNTPSIGGYLYVDAFPFVDLDVELNIKFRFTILSQPTALNNVTA